MVAAYDAIEAVEFMGMGGIPCTVLRILLLPKSTEGNGIVELLCEHRSVWVPLW